MSDLKARNACVCYHCIQTLICRLNRHFVNFLGAIGKSDCLNRAERFQLFQCPVIEPAAITKPIAARIKGQQWQNDDLRGDFDAIGGYMRAKNATLKIAN